MPEIITATIKTYIQSGMLEAVSLNEYEEGTWTVDFHVAGQEDPFRYISTHGEYVRTYKNLDRAYRAIRGMVGTFNCKWNINVYKGPKFEPDNE